MANVVGIVLTFSRLTVGLSSAASMIRAVREVKAYSRFRKAFGVPVDQFPMLANQIEDIDTCARRATAGAFKLYSQVLGLAGANVEVVSALSLEINELVRHPNLFAMDDQTRDICRRWDSFCHRLIHAYQDTALTEVMAS